MAALLEGLDADQHIAVTTPAAPLAIVAGPGAGKTRVLTRRIAHRVAIESADARHVLAITFTRRAAAELTTRLRQLGLRDHPTVGTFHAVALRILRQRATDAGRRFPDIQSDRPRLVAAALASGGGGGGGGGRSRAAASNAPHPFDIATEIDWARARLVRPEDYVAEARQAGRRPTAGLAAVATAYARYEEHKRQRRVLDLDDLLERLAEEIERDPAFAEVQRWRFRHLFVDEFQDVNPLQLRLLAAWRGAGTDLCVVGDPHQAIYAWNGADPTVLTDLGRHLPGVTVVRLTANHRATPALVAASTAVLDDPPPLYATRPDGPPPTVHDFADERAEAEGIGRLLDGARLPGTTWSACAVLVRTRAQVAPVLEGLARLGIPARARRSSVLDDPEVRTALASAPPPDAAYGLRDWLGELDDTDVDRAPERGEALTQVIEVARRAVLEEPAAAVRELRNALEGGDHGPGAVDVTTFHAAKGLEWPVVVVAGCEDGLVPIGTAPRSALDEERRLLYVAMTRAERRLFVTWARQRTFSGGTPQPRQRSPYLDRVPFGTADDAATAPPPVLTGRLPRPQTARPAHAPVLDALQQWRATAARAAGVPPHVVCTDAVLRAVAERRPQHVDDLADVPGLSPMAVRRFGARLVDVVAGAGRA